MVDLNDREWKEFKVGVLFKIEKCKCGNAGKLLPGNIPYVGATDVNNGNIKYCGNTELISKGKCIVFVCDGQGSVGSSFYKEENFVGSTTLKVGRNINLNIFNALFITSALNKNREIYSFGYKRNTQRLSNETIHLPSTPEGEPDYAFMEQYVKERQNIMLEEYRNYAEKQLEEIEYKPITKLEECEWKEFRIDKLFTIKKVYGKPNDKYNNGNYPYISTSGTNNGQIDFVKADNSSVSSGNTISVDPIKGICFFHKYDFVGREFSGASINLLYNDYLNEYNGLFLCRVIQHTASLKANYSNLFNGQRLNNGVILLPVTPTGEPDYEYMEQYSKNIVKMILTKYLS